MFSEQIKMLRKSKHLTQQQLADVLGLSRSTIGMYEKGEREPDFETSELIADFFNVPMDDLIGRKSSIKYNPPDISTDNVEFAIIGDVAAGFDKIAIEEWTGDTINIPKEYLKGHNKDEFFVLRVKGDSMYPDYKDGDKILVLKQSAVDYSGQVAVAIYNDECGTIMKIEYKKDSVSLVPINPQYPPEIIKGTDIERVHILGIPKLLLRDLDED